MKLYLLLVTLTIVNAGVVPDTKCDGVIIDDKYYDKEILKTGLDRAFSLAVDYNTNMLYFSYMNTIPFKSALFDLNTKKIEEISNYVPFGHGQAIDQNAHDVYIGGQGGIYKYDHKNHTSELYIATNNYAYNLFFKENLYYSEFYSEFMYTYVYIDGKRAIFEDLKDTRAREFVIDGEDVIFYYNATGFYSQKKGSKDAVLFVYSDEFHVKALTVDIYGNSYLCTEQAIYKINKNKISLDKLMDVNHCWGLAFDSYNNMIYSERNSLLRLKVNKDKTC